MCAIGTQTLMLASRLSMLSSLRSSKHEYLNILIDMSSSKFQSSFGFGTSHYGWCIAWWGEIAC